MIVQCKHFTQEDCPVVFEDVEFSACDQLSSHLKGSHGITVSASSIAEYYNPVTKEKVAKIETITNLEKVDGKTKKKPVKKVGKDKWWLKK